MVKVLARGLIGLALGLSLISAGVIYYGYQWLNSALPVEGEIYQLKQGETLSHLVTRLARQDVLAHPKLLLGYARLTKNSHVKAGEYRLSVGTTPLELLRKLNRGTVVQHRVTLVEGWTFEQALTALHARNDIKAVLKGKSRKQQLELLDLNLEHPEGWFFPDSYRYARGTTDVELLRIAHEKMRRVLTTLWQDRAEGLPYETPYEALIMASIVERETGAPWEREAIAGVFVRRLRRGMRLQTDPTVIYGMGSDYQGRITYADLRTPTPYNTYTSAGLPPTPIALPGEEAIYAALNPAKGDSLYFVAKGDGTHVFSDTLEAHNEAVREYQLNRSEDYRSTPPPVESETSAGSGS